MRVILPLGALLVAGLFIIGFFDWWQKREVGVTKPKSPATPLLAAKSDSGDGGVTVTAQPVITGGDDIIFEFIIDTHSGDLTDFAVLEKVRLISGGRETLPKEWQETANSGHHRAGRLVFELMGMGELELVIKGLAGIPERRLKWTL